MDYIVSVFGGLSQLVLTIYILLYEYRHRSTGVYLWCMLLVVFSLTHFVSVIGEDKKYPLWVYNYASCFVLIFNLLYIISRNVLNKPHKKCIQVQTELSVTQTYSTFIKIMFLIMIISLFVRIHHLSQYSGSLMETSWSDMHNSGGGYFGVEIVFRLFFYFSSTIFLLALYEGNRKKILLFASFIIFCVIITRNRADILPFLISIITYYIYKKKLSVKLVAQLSLVGVGAVLLITGVLLFRFYGSINSFVENVDPSTFVEDILDMTSEGGGDLDVRDALYKFILYDNNYEGFNQMHTYIRLFMFAIPTQWSLGLKPVDFAETMGWAYDPNEGRGYSMHPTLYGDCFANAYYFGVFLAVFWAYIVYLIDNFLDKRNDYEKLCGVVMVGCAFIMVGRGSAYNPITSLIYEFLFLIIVHKVTLLILSRKKKTKILKRRDI